MAARTAVKVKLTVTIEMTAAQLAEYGSEYGTEAAAPDAVESRFRNDVHEALNAAYWMREFATVAVSGPKAAPRREGAGA